MYQDEDMSRALQDIANKVQKAKDSVAFTEGSTFFGQRVTVDQSIIANYRPSFYNQDENHKKRLSDALLDLEIDYWGFKV